MAAQYDALVAKLWAACRDGKRPVCIRMAYPTYYEHMQDAEFNAEIDLSECGEYWTFQTLRVKIDSWHKVPHIEVA